MNEKIKQLKEQFLGLSTTKKVAIVTGCAVLLLGGGYGVSALMGQSEAPVRTTVAVDTTTTTTKENKGLKSLTEKVDKASATPLKKQDKEALEKEIKESKDLSDKEKEELLKKLSSVALAEETSQATTQAPKEENTTTSQGNQVADNSNTSSSESNYSTNTSDNSGASSYSYDSSSDSQDYSSSSSDSQSSYVQPSYQPETTQAPQTQKYRLEPLGSSGMEFSTFQEAQAWATAIFKNDDRLEKEIFAKGWSSWVAYPVFWSDGSTTYTVDFS